MNTKLSRNAFPFLFTIYPLLHLYANNMATVDSRDVLVGLGVGLALTTALFYLFRLLLKDGFSAGLLVTFCVILFYAYGHTHLALRYILRVGQLHAPLLVVWAVLLALMVYVVFERGSRLATLALTLNAMGLLLVSFSVARIASYTVRDARVHAASTEAMEDVAVGRTLDRDLPDIYYIILDEYGRHDILLDYYGYDNTSFIDALTARGFYVARESRSNYSRTVLSLASSLNMRYLNDPNDETRAAVPSMETMHEILVDSAVSRTLKDLGYTYVHIGSGWGPTADNDYADVLYTYQSPSLYSHLVYESSLLNVFYDPYEENRNRFAYTFAQLAAMPSNDAPTFVFAHIVSPHPPYLFDRDGNPRSRREAAQMEIAGWWEQDSAYIEQLIYVNSWVEALVDEILAESETPPIIIVQSDHGTASTSMLTTLDEASDALIAERMPILNAYYLPGDGASLLYPSVTPVNSFRIVFDAFFDADLGLLEDKSYFSANSPAFEFRPLQ